MLSQLQTHSFLASGALNKCCTTIPLMSTVEFADARKHYTRKHGARMQMEERANASNRNSCAALLNRTIIFLAKKKKNTSVVKLKKAGAAIVAYLWLSEHRHGYLERVSKERAVAWEQRLLCARTRQPGPLGQPAVRRPRGAAARGRGFCTPRPRALGPRRTQRHGM